MSLKILIPDFDRFIYRIKEHVLLFDFNLRFYSLWVWRRINHLNTVHISTPVTVCRSYRLGYVPCSSLANTDCYAVLPLQSKRNIPTGRQFHCLEVDPSSSRGWYFGWNNVLFLNHVSFLNKLVGENRETTITKYTSNKNNKLWYSIWSDQTDRLCEKEPFDRYCFTNLKWLPMHLRGDRRVARTLYLSTMAQF